MLIGYARISTKYQSMDMQIESLKKAGCEKIYQDQVSGGTNIRPGLASALDAVRKGDTLVVWKLDRLGRCVKHLVNLFNDLSKEGVNFLSITEDIDTSTPMGTFLFHVMAGMAQMERDLTSERVKAGIEAAKLRGDWFGRKRKFTDSKIASAKKLLATGMKVKDVARDLAISVPTFYRWLPALEYAMPPKDPATKYLVNMEQSET
jgi:DNA invertase Pin-like site-specific DNA recombinase